MGVYSLTGLLAARLVTSHGARPVCVLGAALSAAGLLLASFSQSLVSLLLSYSLLTGVGFGLMYVPAVVAVAEHFTKRQSLAMGLCVCGTGLGTFLLAPAELFMLENLGWRWTLRSMASLCLLCILAGLVMTPPDLRPSRRKSSLVSLQTGSSQTSCSSLSRSLMSVFLSSDLMDSPGLRTYLLVTLADGVATLALFIPFTFLPSLATSQGISPSDAAFLISAAGLSSSTGRLLSGLLCDRSCDD